MDNRARRSWKKLPPIGKPFLALALIAILIGASTYAFWSKPGLPAVPPARNKMALDADSDGIQSGDEISYGLNPLIIDSDLDTIPDNTERYWYLDSDQDGSPNALDVDSDSDGLLDNEEDLNRNGLVDDGETDPAAPDTDSDGLLDGEETLWKTDPCNLDSDGDGVRDGEEPAWNSDSDGDGLINALDRDSDDDGIEDGVELELATNPVKPDSDDDGAEDRVEVSLGINPLDPDTDNDGLIDGLEAAAGAYWYEAENLVSSDQVQTDSAAEGGAAAKARSTGEVLSLSLSSQPGRYRVYLRARCTASTSGQPILWVSVENVITSVHALRFFTQQQVSNPKLPSNLPPSYLPLIFSFNVQNQPSTPTNIYSWYSTPEFELVENVAPDLNVYTAAGETVLVDRILVLKTDNTYRLPTDPLNPDTDEDGVLDGDESSLNTWWYEAEDFASLDLVRPNMNAGNGADVVRGDGSTILCTIADNTLFPAGNYQLYIRGGKTSYSAPSLSLIADVFSDSEQIAQLTSALTYLYEWNLATSNTALYFTLSKNARLKISIRQNSSSSGDVGFVDKILLVRLGTDEAPFAPKESTEFYHEEYRLPEENVLYDENVTVYWYFDNAGGYMMFTERQLDLESAPHIIGWEPYPKPARVVKVNVPRLLLDPMDPDTDHDGYRAADGAIPGSAGNLTDGKELKVGMNPLDTDTDGDGIPDNIDFNPLTDDSDSDGLLDGQEDTVAPYGLQDTLDDGDYLEFLDDDTDDDGILDGNEDSNFNGMRDPEETDPRDPDTDDDGITDGVEIGLSSAQGENTGGWTGDADPTTTTDLLNPDTDADGLKDGEEDGNHNGRMDSGETDPLNPDTDGDGLKDSEDPEPLTPNSPDLTVNADEVELTPPDVDVSLDSVSLSARIRNEGYVGFSGKSVCVAFFDGNPDNGGEVIGFGILSSLDPGESKLVPLSHIPASAAQSPWYKEGGCHRIYVKILTNPAEPMPSWAVQAQFLSEENYLNNIAHLEIRVKAPPSVDAGPDQGMDAFIWTGDEVSFQGEATDPDGTVVKYEWDFDGDGVYDWSSGTTGAATHVYDEAGTYTARLRATDDTGYSGTDEAIIVVYSSQQDSDYDTLPDVYERSIGTDPNSNDSDGDGLYDDWEFAVAELYGTLALDDCDNDNLPNVLDPDSDNDGIKDGEEIQMALINENDVGWWGSNPFYWDTDFDGLSDYEEESELPWSSRLKADTDSDGLNDYKEVKVYHTGANNPDSDHDGVPDGVDLAPLITPEQPPWFNQFPPGMIRFTQRYEAHGIVGHSEVWHWVWESWPDGHEEFWYSTGSDGTRSSNITPAAVVNAINKYWIDSGFTPLSATYRGAWYTSGAYWKHWHADGWHPKGYRIEYDRDVKEYDVDFKNTVSLLNKDEEGNPYYFTVIPIAIKPGVDQSIIWQCGFVGWHDRYSFGDDAHYTVPAFLYSVYPDNDWNDDSNLPLYRNLAVAVELAEHAYQFEFRIPREYTSYPLLYLHLIPCWLVRNGGEHYRKAMYPGSVFVVGAVARKIVISENEWINLIYRSPENLRAPVPDPSVFGVPTKVTVEIHTVINKTAEENQQENAYVGTVVERIENVMEIGDTVISWISTINEVLYESSADALFNKIADILDDCSMELEDLASDMERLGKAEAAADLRKIAADYRAQAEEYRKATGGKYGKVSKALSVAAIGVILVDDGSHAVLAYRENDQIKFTLYVVKAGVGIVKEVAAIAEGTALASRYGSLKALGNTKAQAALALAIGGIEASIYLYESTQTEDEIVKLSCYEAASAAVIDAAISAVPLYGQAVELAWGATAAIARFVAPADEKWKEEVCSSPGSAITFLVEYFYTTTIPSGIAEEAYKFAAQGECGVVNWLNSAGAPAVFIQPD